MSEQAHILVLDDDATLGAVLHEALSAAGHRVTLKTRIAEVEPVLKTGVDILVTDVLMPDGNSLDHLAGWRKHCPDVPVILMSAHSTAATAMRAAEEGAYDYLPKPFDLEDLDAACRRALEDHSAVLELSSTATAAESHAEALDRILIGRSPKMQALYRTMGRIAQTDLTVLIIGESGTGKELVARALHDHGPRNARPFVSLNMAAIPRELIESELFGHERGAFTGAERRYAGRFSEAAGGTLFLDEIGDMPIEAQTRLLRVLQNGEYRPIGGGQAKTSDVRIVSATHRDLVQEVKAGQFREDLYYRLNVVPVHIPPLRERLDDLDDLVDHFLLQAPRAGLGEGRLTAQARQILRHYPWPGNVRELQNTVYRLVALSGGKPIEPADVEAVIEPVFNSAGEKLDGGLESAINHHLDQYFASLGTSKPADGLHGRMVRELERPLIARTLAYTGGNQVQAARILGLNRNTLRQRLRDLDIRPSEKS